MSLQAKEKPKPESKYHAEFNMGMQDYERFHEILKRLDDLRFDVMQYKLRSVIPMIAALDCLFANLQSCLTDETIKNVKNDISKIKNKISFGKRTIPTPTKEYNIVEELANIHDRLLHLKQVAGIGYPIKAKVKEVDKVKAALK